MKTVGAAQFKEHCLSLLDEVDEEGIVITKHGKPVAKLVPWTRASADSDRLAQGPNQDQGGDPATGARWRAES